MKLSSILLLISILFLAGCSKKTQEDDNLEPPPPTKNQITQVVTQGLDMNGTVIVDTIKYTYDDSGRVTSRFRSSSKTKEDFRYTGDKISFIGYINGTDSINNLNHASYSADGDTILLDFSRPNSQGGTDTVQLTYIFMNNMRTDYWLYVTFGNNSNFQKEKFIYNGAGNLTTKTFENLLSPVSTTFSADRWDDKINPAHDQPKLNTSFLQLGIPVQSGGVNNPTRFTDFSGQHEVEMTYNAAGYPLTFKLKDESFTRATFTYN